MILLRTPCRHGQPGICLAGSPVVRGPECPGGQPAEPDYEAVATHLHDTYCGCYLDAGLRVVHRGAAPELWIPIARRIVDAALGIKDTPDA